ncbi:MAG TPA: hypothetical protein VFU40_10290 [Gemmatimonadales bacterium]|nr:hypothetical protein [Gemmatimonadales bacterium]
MMHLDEEQLQRVLHGQLPSRAARSAGDHLAECGECRQRFVMAEREERQVLALLRQVDHPVPVVDPEALVARLRWTGAAWGRWAAGILLLLGLGGAAYALPGSPVRHWIRSAVVWITGSQAPSAPSAETVAPEARAAGIAAAPGRRFVIAFESPEQGGYARVSLTDGSEVSVRAPVGAAGFTSRSGRLYIANAGVGATYEIEIPRDAPRVEIRVAGARVFVKDGARIAVDRSDIVDRGYLLRLFPSRP